MNPPLPFTVHRSMARLDIPRCVNAHLQVICLHRLRMAKQVVTRTYTASIRNQSRVQDDLDSCSGSQLRNSGTSAGGHAVGSGMKSITSQTTTNSPPTLKTTNATMICIRSQVSESFKNSLRRSTVGTANGATETRERTRPATGNTATTIRVPRSRSKAAGFKLDTQYNRVRLSKGSNLKAYWSDFTPL